MEPSSQNPSIAKEEAKETHYESSHCRAKIQCLCSETNPLQLLQVKGRTNGAEDGDMVKKCNSCEPLDDKKKQDHDESGRDRLKRHRIEVAGSVWIPEIWGQEDLLKDWIDCSAFEANFVHNRIMSARSALAQEARTSNSGNLRIENRC